MMAFNNPVFDPRIEENANSTKTDDDHEIMQGKTVNQIFGRHKPEKDAYNFCDPEIIGEHIYQQPVSPRSVEMVSTRPSSMKESMFPPRVQTSSPGVEYTLV